MSVCEVCNVKLSSRTVREQHEQGKKHKRRIRLNAAKVVCEICNMCLSPGSVVQHEQGRKHRRRVEIVRHAEETLADLSGLYERVMPLLLQDPPVDVHTASLSSLAKTLKKRNFGPACIKCLVRFETEDLLRAHLLTCSCGAKFVEWSELEEHLDAFCAHTVHIYGKNLLKGEREHVLQLINGMDQQDEETQQKIHRAKVVFAAKYSLLIHVIHHRHR